MLAGGLSLGYIGLLVAGLRVRNNAESPRVWLLATLFLALLAQGVHLLVSNAHQGPYRALFIGGLTQPALAVLLTSLMLIGFAALSLRYLGRFRAAPVVILGLFWWMIVAVVVAQTPDKQALLGQPGWITKAFTVPVDSAGLLVVGVWAALGLSWVLAALVGFYTAHLPEVANRALYWMIIGPVTLMGAILGASGSPALRELGWIILFVGLCGAVYGVNNHRVLDIRQLFKATFSTGLTLAAILLVLLSALFVARQLDPNAPNLSVLLIALAVAGTAAYVPLRGLAIWLNNRIFGTPPEDATAYVREYNQNVSGIVELRELSDIAINVLMRTLRVRRAALLLATREDNDTIRIEPMQSATSDMPEVRAWIPKGGPVYRKLFEQRAALLQYDLEYSPEFTPIAPELKSFFKQLRMSAYAPIVIQDQLIGVMAAGSKSNDDPFSMHDMELLATIASQTGVALRNARLVADLRRARDETEALNHDISRTKERLEQLDKVKSDFVTIASHELRTPLTQIRGYTDILDTLNDQGMVDSDQLAGMTNNLRKATERMERLIGDMLDVSQIGIDAMDLRFGPTTLESVVRLAIEPLTESIKQRKLQVTARGLKSLPEIDADGKRLVQAIQNVVLNAIKYTPDGGRVDIVGRLDKNEQTGAELIHATIQDSGIGIDSQHHELIFEKFYRVADPGLHSTGTTKFLGAGPGLGLTIARGVIQGHGGRIWVESPGYDPEKLPGTTVHILLPVDRPDTAKRLTPFEAPSQTKPVTVPAEISAAKDTGPLKRNQAQAGAQG